MGLSCFLINSLLAGLGRKKYRELTGISDLRARQEAQLLDILRKNAGTEYGRRYGFSEIRSAAEYQKRAPLTSYEDYEGFIGRIAAGEQNLLTAERVLLLEPTSGSSGERKLIPYTAGLKAEFQNGIKPWLYDLYTREPKLKWGKSYWSVTPAAAVTEDTQGVPVGFEEDGAYFGRLEERLLNLVFAVRGSVARAPDMERFYFLTARSLLNCKNLALVSVWNPTYLLLLLDYIRENRERLLNALPARRARELRGPLHRGDFGEAFPRLRIISCWCDANAAPYAGRVQEAFPGAKVQPKGILSTEGFTSLPLLGEEGARLSVLSHFFEFLPEEGGAPVLAHQLREGGVYEEVLTTAGGLYRYRTGDFIRVVGFSGATPRIRFVGKGDLCCDLFGEKLNAGFVEKTVGALLPDGSFYLLAPDTDRYILFTQGSIKNEDLDLLLRRNFHYDYCRKLGQLRPAAVFFLTGNPEAEYMEECVRRGQRLGDVKIRRLVKTDGWERAFKGEFL